MCVRLGNVLIFFNCGYKFGNIEDAMVFTEDVIKNCISLEEIEEGYNLYKESKEENKENSEEIKEVKVKKKTKK